MEFREAFSRLGEQVEIRVGKVKNGKGAGKDEVTGEMINSGGNRVVD